MKKIFAVIFLVFCFAFTSFAAEKKAQTYNVTITVEYKDIDLKTIAEKEAQIKKLFGDAYNVKIEFKTECPSNGTIYWQHNNPVFTPSVVD